MAVTRLKRKGAKNKSRAKTRVATIQRLSQKPVYKNVDVEAIKAEWAAEKGKTTAAKEPKAEAPAAAEAPAKEEKGE
ncbi:MAG TPA: hypothetical protein DCE41_30575 [Cytophagales bacterium]|nr:hypothetical protein [Cytophagales bacterium]HAA24375.1 hypothetical protein [Cytophagales bacterium]HAP61925.1 hypothetical protein [Cytophagales bacterium]